MIDVDAIKKRIDDARGYATAHETQKYAHDIWKALASDAEQLLASHLAMAQAVEELPDPVAIAHVAINNRGSLDTKSVLDLFRPIVARLRKERDEARELARFHANDTITERGNLHAIQGQAHEERLARLRAQQYEQTLRELAEERTSAERAEARLAAVKAACDALPACRCYDCNEEPLRALVKACQTDADPVLEAISRAPVVTISADEQAELDRLAQEAQMAPGVSTEVVLFGLLKRAREENGSLVAERDALKAWLSAAKSERDAAKKEIWSERDAHSVTRGERDGADAEAKHAWSDCEKAQTERDGLRTRLDETLLKLREEQVARAIDKAEIQKLDVRSRYHHRNQRGMFILLRYPEMSVDTVVTDVWKQSPDTDENRGHLRRTLTEANGLIQRRIASAVDALVVPLNAAIQRARYDLELVQREFTETKVIAVEGAIALTEARERIADLESRLAEAQSDNGLDVGD